MTCMHAIVRKIMKFDSERSVKPLIKLFIFILSIRVISMHSIFNFCLISAATAMFTSYVKTK